MIPVSEMPALVAAGKPRASGDDPSGGGGVACRAG